MRTAIWIIGSSLALASLVGCEAERAEGVERGVGVERDVGVGAEETWLGYEDTGNRVWYTRDPGYLREVEQRLSALGYDPGPIDGVMNDEFRSALMNFEQQRGLERDGVLDRATAQALGVGSPTF